jgi:hypothetical protein
MRQLGEDHSIGRTTIAGLGVVLVAFMALSLFVTATGTARFAVSMGYDDIVGNAVGVIFDLGKGLLPIALLALWSRCVVGTAGLLFIAWRCLATYSCLATHATVSSSITGIERTGTWKMEVRGNTIIRPNWPRSRSSWRRCATPRRHGRPRQLRSRLLLRACRRIFGGIAASAPKSSKAPISRRHARKSSSCVASWQRPGTMSGCLLVPASYARAWRRLPLSPPLIHCPPHSAPPSDACCRSEERRVWRSCSPSSSRS